MLVNLKIQNAILIESADIPFASSFNTLSGETGAGKSAILQSLKQILGARTETGLVRNGASKASMEAFFEIPKGTEIPAILEEGGIDYTDGDPLIIKREVYESGKSRAFINHQSAHLSLLKRIGALLVQFVGQHANQQLLLVENHRKIVDTFGCLSPELFSFQDSWKKLQDLRKDLRKLKSNEAKRLRQIEVCKMEIEELEKADPQEGEEQSLFAEFSRLENATSLAQNLEGILQQLTDNQNSIVSQLTRTAYAIQDLEKFDPLFHEQAKITKNAQMELEESAYSLRGFLERLEYNPARQAQVNDRLVVLNKIKRKYGDTIEEVLYYKAKSAETLEELEGADLKIEEMEHDIITLENETQNKAELLTEKRQQASAELEKQMTEEIQSLNMKDADFRIQITPVERSTMGDDKLEFFMAPNLGERLSPIRESASGGELSRVILSLKVILAEKEQIPILVFDEIDGNIGGKTASIIGEKLCHVGEHHQVISITHFPQVASQAAHHLFIQKNQENGRTVTTVSLLDEESRKDEISRMLGGGVMA